MALISTQTTIRVEDFPSEKSWIGKLLQPLNRFLLSVTQTINGNITFGDNIPAQTQVVTFTYNSASDFPKTFAWTLPVTPKELRVCTATENGTPIAIGFAWSFGNNIVSIASIFKQTSSGNSSLTAGTSYTITFRGNP